jgi:hypothetical protein
LEVGLLVIVVCLFQWSPYPPSLGAGGILVASQ